MLGAKRGTLVLDWDETLVSYHRMSVGWGGYADAWAVRPHVGPFLHWAFSAFERVGIWSGAPASALQEGLRYTGLERHPWSFVWGRNRCGTNYHTRGWVKDLRKLRSRLGVDRRTTLAVDDIPENWWRSYGNIIPINPWEGDENDNALEELQPFLAGLQALEDVRPVHKLNWRTGWKFGPVPSFRPQDMDYGWRA